MDREERLRRLVALLREGRCTASELARRLGVCVRTIYRNVRALGRRGVAIGSALGPGGGFWLVGDASRSAVSARAGEVGLAALHIQPDEAAVVALALKAVGADALARRVVEALPAAWDERAALAPLVQFDGQAARGAALQRAEVSEVFAACVRGMHERRLMWMRLQGRGERVPRGRVFEPVAMKLAANGWVIEGWDRGAREMATLTVRHLLGAQVRPTRLPRAIGADRARGSRSSTRPLLGATEALAR